MSSVYEQFNEYIYIYISKFTVGAVLEGDARTFF